MKLYHAMNFYYIPLEGVETVQCMALLAAGPYNIEQLSIVRK
jgi:hypothetical protein